MVQSYASHINVKETIPNVMRFVMTAIPLHFTSVMIHHQKNILRSSHPCIPVLWLSLMALKIYTTNVV